MSNPFSGTITGKSTTFPSAGVASNLVYALIPRSTTVVKEIITDTTATLSGGGIGSYDEDGYLFGSSSTSAIAEVSVTGFAQSGTYSMICGYKNAGTSGGFTPYCWMYKSGETYVSAGFQMDTFSNRIRPFVQDGTRMYFPSYASLSDSHVGVGVSSKPGAQAGGYVTATASPPSGSFTPYAGETYTCTGGTMNRLSAELCSDWGFQYVFVYTSELTANEMETIIEQPGSVLTYEAASGSSKSTRFFLMGMG